MEEIYKFLEELEKNNNREWFTENKDRYTTLKEGFEFMVDQLINEIAQFDTSIQGVMAKNCLFRIYRDVRFSNDKTPYKTHFSAWIVQGGKKSEYPGYYFQIKPGRTLLAAGIWNPDKKLRQMIRQDIVDNTEDYLEVIEDKEFKKVLGGIVGDKLKRAPKGFDPKFEPLELILQQDFIFQKEVKETFFTKNWLEKAGEIFEMCYRFNRMLYPIVDEYMEHR